MNPLKITVRLGSPVMLSYPWIMLDSLLMHLALERDHPGLLASLDPRNPVDLDVPLPLAMVRVGGAYLYKGSCSRFSEGVKASTMQVRKHVSPDDVEYLASPPKRLDIVRGAFKAYDMRMTTINARECTWHAVGDRDGVARLLENLDGLGKKRAIGYGRVLGVSVERCQEDWSIVHPIHGLNRPVPVSMAPSIPGVAGATTGEVANLAYRPPYWAKELHVPCHVPAGFGG